MPLGLSVTSPARARDDRGRDVAILDPGGLARQATLAADKKHRSDLAAWLKKVASQRNRLTWGNFFGDVGMVIVGIVALLVMRYALRLMGVSWPMILVLWIVLLVVITQWQSKKRVRPFVAASMVTEGICGSCGYALAGLPVEADRCVVCPECGAAWRASRMTARRAEAAGGATRTPWGRPVTFWGGNPVRRCGADANGRLVPLMQSHLHGLERQRRREIGAERLREVSRAVRAEGSGARAWLSLGALSVLGWFGLWAMLGSPRAAAASGSAAAGTGVVATGVTLLVIGAALGLAILGSDLFISEKRRVRTIVEHGLCPSCGAGMEAASRDELGRVVCGACGSAWAAEGVRGEEKAVKNSRIC